MPQTVIYLDSEIEKKIIKLKEIWRLSKSDVIQKIIKMYFEEGEGTEIIEQKPGDINDKTTIQA
jgi:hypothetical protein